MTKWGSRYAADGNPSRGKKYSLPHAPTSRPLCKKKDGWTEQNLQICCESVTCKSKAQYNWQRKTKVLSVSVKAEQSVGDNRKQGEEKEDIRY